MEAITVDLYGALHHEQFQQRPTAHSSKNSSGHENVVDPAFSSVRDKQTEGDDELTPSSLLQPPQQHQQLPFSNTSNSNTALHSAARSPAAPDTSLPHSSSGDETLVGRQGETSNQKRLHVGEEGTSIPASATTAATTSSEISYVPFPDELRQSCVLVEVEMCGGMFPRFQSMFPQFTANWIQNMRKSHQTTTTATTTTSFSSQNTSALTLRFIPGITIFGKVVEIGASVQQALHSNYNPHTNSIPCTSVGSVASHGHDGNSFLTTSSLEAREGSGSASTAAGSTNNTAIEREELRIGDWVIACTPISPFAPEKIGGGLCSVALVPAPYIIPVQEYVVRNYFLPQLSSSTAATTTIERGTPAGSTYTSQHNKGKVQRDPQLIATVSTKLQPILERRVRECVAGLPYLMLSFHLLYRQLRIRKESSVLFLHADSPGTFVAIQFAKFILGARVVCAVWSPENKRLLLEVGTLPEEILEVYNEDLWTAAGSGVASDLFQKGGSPRDGLDESKKDRPPMYNSGEEKDFSSPQSSSSFNHLLTQYLLQKVTCGHGFQYVVLSGLTPEENLLGLKELALPVVCYTGGVGIIGELPTTAAAETELDMLQRKKKARNVGGGNGGVGNKSNSNLFESMKTDMSFCMYSIAEKQLTFATTSLNLFLLGSGGGLDVLSFTAAMRECFSLIMNLEAATSSSSSFSARKEREVTRRPSKSILPLRIPLAITFNCEMMMKGSISIPPPSAESKTNEGMTSESQQQQQRERDGNPLWSNNANGAVGTIHTITDRDHGDDVLYTAARNVFSSIALSEKHRTVGGSGSTDGGVVSMKAPSNTGGGQKIAAAAAVRQHHLLQGFGGGRGRGGVHDFADEGIEAMRLNLAHMAQAGLPLIVFS